MKIKAAENGPYLIEVQEASVKRGDKEEKLAQKTIALCRCGHSANKPFCDGAHKKHGFTGEQAELDIS
ncbi:Iron sulfur domain-containing, CDGSH-type [Melioribacter roseus P3M-2]|uniref:Iron sulfur domain-containing, CDGSH-type n=1 Tax=Melioribacter roseus (strain DSM 23840 / JCM 17771 / VKM B-2668 / P3M-2) TaxID=1191523 RepID=I6Z569_MELRP|nr:CDGSH iron-sulfur domain-containing protein [Melioribacter roseus]AFN74300.1 Iron sulfur domain-containing, CDGSH-type [Melioribacter roseus P3M-2]